MAGNADEELWISAISGLDTPVAITAGNSPDLRVLACSDTLLEALSTDVSDLAGFLGKVEAEAREGQLMAVPDRPEWLLKSQSLPGANSNRLWQVTRRSAETTTELIAEWVTTATLGDMAMFFFDPEGRLRAYNDGVRNFFPQSRSFPVIGEPFRQQLDAIIDTYDFEGLKSHEEAWIADLMEGYLNPGQPKVGPTPTGRWALSTTTVMGDGSRIQVMNDVTEFRERDQQLKLYMRNAQGILFSRRELKPDGKLQVWGDTGAMKSEKPMSPDGYSGTQGWFQLIDERDRDWYIDFMKAIEPGSAPYSIEMRSRVAGSDEVRWTREIGWTVQDRTGNHYLDAIYFDITSAKRTAEALADSTTRFQQFAELASDWYYETDSDDIVSFISDRYEKIGGRSPSEIIGNSFLAQIKGRIAAADEADKGAWKEFGKLWEGRQPIRNHSLRIPGPNGKSLTLETSAEPMFDEDGGFRGYRGIGRDLTSLTDAQFEALESLSRAEQANESKSAFIANVSHELRTPLNAILGFSSVMADELLGPMENERYRRYAADIHLSGNHLLSLVNDLLDISKVEAGRYTIEDEQIDLVEEVTRAFALIEQQAGDRTLVNLCHRADTLLRADRRAIRQVLINIVANAVKFTAETGSISATTSLASDGRLILSIQDDGIGIAANELERVLQPFGRASTHIASEGTGLGLPLSRNLIELHGGTLEVDSTPGEGTRIDMHFPPERVLPRDSKALATG